MKKEASLRQSGRERPEVEGKRAKKKSGSSYPTGTTNTKISDLKERIVSVRAD